MADITFKYEGMQQAVEEIQALAGRYGQEAATFESDFISAISSWEGDSHDKMVNFIQSPVHEYIAETIPQLLNSFAELLQENITQMQKADQQIAENIPASLG